MKKLFRQFARCASSEISSQLQYNFQFQSTNVRFYFNSIKQPDNYESIKLQIQQLQIEKEKAKQFNEQILIDQKIINLKQQLYQFSNDYDKQYFQDLIQYGNQQFQAQNSEECQKAFNQIFSNKYFKEQLQNNNLQHLLIYLQANSLAANFYSDREIDLTKAYEFAIEGYKMQSKLISEHCPLLQSIIQNTQIIYPEKKIFEQEMAIIKSSNDHLSISAHITKIQGKSKESLKYLSERSYLNSQILTFIEKCTYFLIDVFLDFMKNPNILVTDEEQQKFNRDIIRNSMDQVAIYFEMIKLYMDLNYQNECFQIVKQSHELLQSLLYSNLIDETNRMLITSQQLFISAILKFNPNYKNLPQLVTNLTNLIENAQNKIEKSIYHELTFDLLLIQQKLNSNKLNEMYSTLENLKELGNPRTSQKEIDYQYAVFENFVRQKNNEQAWVQSQILLKLFKKNKTHQLRQKYFTDFIFETCELAIQLKKYSQAHQLIEEIEKSFLQNFNDQIFTVQYNFVKGKILIEEEINEKRVKENIRKGIELLELSLDILEKNHADQIQKRSHILEQIADYNVYIDDKKEARSFLEKQKILLQNSNLPNKEELLIKNQDKFRQLEKF